MAQLVLVLAAFVFGVSAGHLSAFSTRQDVTGFWSRKPFWMAMLAFSGAVIVGAVVVLYISILPRAT